MGAPCVSDGGIASVLSTSLLLYNVYEYTDGALMSDVFPRA